MESSSLPLATDSFSYSWLPNPNDSPLDHHDLRISVYSSYHQNFNFDVSNLQSPPPTLAHADELFSDGLIRPLFLDPSSPSPSSHATMSTSSSSSSSRSVPAGTSSHGFLKKWRRSTTRRSLRGLVRHLILIFRKLGWSRKSTRVGDIDHKAEWEASPKPIHGGGAHCHHENSIYEAVLHCKRSFGMYNSNICLYILFVENLKPLTYFLLPCVCVCVLFHISRKVMYVLPQMKKRRGW